MHIAYVKLDCGSIRGLRKPEVEICAVLASFEEEDVIAGMEVCEGVEGGIVVVA